MQKRNKERVNVFLDGQYAFSLPLITAATLRTGQELSESDIARLKKEDEYERAKESALTLITQRPRSTRELHQRLTRKGYDELTIEQVLERLTDLDLLSDRQFAKYWVDQRETFKPRGRRALQAELAQKGIDREIAAEVLEGLDELDAAQRAIQPKKYRWQQLPPDQLRKKATGFLQRRGFGYDIIRQVLDQFVAEQSDEDVGL